MGLGSGSESGSGFGFALGFGLRLAHACERPSSTAKSWHSPRERRKTEPERSALLRSGADAPTAVTESAARRAPRSEARSVASMRMRSVSARLREARPSRTMAKASSSTSAFMLLYSSAALPKAAGSGGAAHACSGSESTCASNALQSWIVSHSAPFGGRPRPMTPAVSAAAPTERRAQRSRVERVVRAPRPRTEAPCWRTTEYKERERECYQRRTSSS